LPPPAARPFQSFGHKPFGVAANIIETPEAGGGVEQQKKVVRFVDHERVA